MAIVYQKELPTNKILCAYNNNVIRFNSDSTEMPISAVITFNGLTVTLYPNPTGFFYFNFKDYITGLINTDNFEDDAELLLPTATPYVDWSSKIFLYSEISIAVNLADETTDTDNVNVNWLATMFQLDNKDIIPSTLPKILHEDSLLTFYPGLPFDVTILTPKVVEYYIFTNYCQRL